MSHKQKFAYGNKVMLSMLVALLTLCNASCSSDGNEPDNPSSPGSNNSVVINSDGTATGGAVFSRVDANTFFLDYVKYEIVDFHLEIIGHDENEISDEPKLYAEVTIDGKRYKTRKIGQRSLKGYKIKAISVPVTVTEIGESAFEGCWALTKVELPEGIAYIGEYAFEDCRALTKVELPEGVESIGYKAFYGCSSLTELEFPESLSMIFEGAFFGCSSLGKVTFKGDVPRIWASIFDYLTVAYVPMQYVDNYKKYAYRFSEIIGY